MAYREWDLIHIDLWGLQKQSTDSHLPCTQKAWEGNSSQVHRLMSQRAVEFALFAFLEGMGDFPDERLFQTIK